MNSTETNDTPVYDYVIIGSGFGGSVSAMRLAEKGYRVLVLERGKRYNAEDFPKTNWNIFKYLWAAGHALLWLHGHQLLRRHHGSSTAAAWVAAAWSMPARTSSRPRTSSNAPSGPELADWEAELEPALRNSQPHARARPKTRSFWPADHLLHDIATEMGQRAHLQAHACRHLLRRAGRDRARSLF